jgi:hypothetical protein
VYLPAEKAWATPLLHQLCSFNGEDGRVDDKVDVCSLVGRGLDLMTNAHVDERKPAPDIKPLTKQWVEHIDQQERIDANERARYYR